MAVRHAETVELALGTAVTSKFQLKQLDHFEYTASWKVDMAEHMVETCGIIPHSNDDLRE
jgi:hypothetical protein